MEFIEFSFLQGVLAFLAPCAVALLPGYIVAFVSRSPAGETTLPSRLKRGLKLAFLSILGIFLVYGVAGIMIILAGQLLKDYMKWITIGMGGILMLMGILMLLGKNISFSLNLRTSNAKTESSEAFLFGMAYAVVALGCLFPLFLIVATQAMMADTVLEGGSYVLAYFLGMSGMMILTIFLAVFAKEFLMGKLRKILPHMERITGVLLFIAGIYLMYYQSALF